MNARRLVRLHEYHELVEPITLAHQRVVELHPAGVACVAGGGVFVRQGHALVGRDGLVAGHRVEHALGVFAHERVPVEVALHGGGLKASFCVCCGAAGWLHVALPAAEEREVIWHGVLVPLRPADCERRPTGVEARETIEEALEPRRRLRLVSIDDVEAPVAGSREDRAEATTYRVVKVALVSLHGGGAALFEDRRVLGIGSEGDACPQVHLSQVESELGFLGLRHGGE